jgi:hypothetical protein
LQIISQSGKSSVFPRSIFAGLKKSETHYGVVIKEFSRPQATKMKEFLKTLGLTVFADFFGKK